MAHESKEAKDALGPKSQYIDAYFMYRDHLPMWVVYRPVTSDFPGKWLARMFLSLPKVTKTNCLIFGECLEDVRAQLPPGVFNLGRMQNDDEVIEEVWM